MIELLTGIVILVILGLIVWFQFQSSILPPNALLLFDILQEMGGEEVPSQQQKDDFKKAQQRNP
jgi:hypothetical protein